MNAQDGIELKEHCANAPANCSAEAALAALLNGVLPRDADKRLLAEKHSGEMALVGIATTSSNQLEECISKAAESLDLFTAVAEESALMVLTSNDNARQAIEAITSACGIDDCLAVVSLPFHAFGEIPHQRRLVYYTLDSIDAPGIYEARDRALSYLQNAIKSAIHTDSLIHPALDIIANYDKANQSNLLNTLRVYLENDCNAQKCGRILFLHRNSLVYRIRRIFREYFPEVFQTAASAGGDDRDIDSLTNRFEKRQVKALFCAVGVPRRARTLDLSPSFRKP